ncbi:MAG: hypothetical protein JWM57_3236 [Phycisphaerales bacterium]|nr:hypothetical protein [Phycisphaerales bacterium]
MASSKSKQDLKPGSSAADAAALSGKGDFGIHEKDVAERTYTSENTRAADHGHAQANSYEHTGNRQSGAGARDNGPGSASGGDIDPDFVGLGGVGLSSNIDKQAPHDASESDGSSHNAASGAPSKGQRPTDVGAVGGRHEQINVVTAGDDRTANTAADEISHTDEDDIDNSFRGEVSSAEASGRDDLGR